LSAGLANSDVIIPPVDERVTVQQGYLYKYEYYDERLFAMVDKLQGDESLVVDDLRTAKHYVNTFGKLHSPILPLAVARLSEAAAPCVNDSSREALMCQASYVVTLLRIGDYHGAQMQLDHWNRCGPSTHHKALAAGDRRCPTSG